MKIDDYRAALFAQKALAAPVVPQIWSNSDGFGISIKPNGFRVYNASEIIEAAATLAFKEVEQAFFAAFKIHFTAHLIELRRAATDEFAQLIGGAA
ncbi:MAG: hypothetical protein AB1762_06050 [Gemmatimonadota bacterium]